ncbi:hypothetical protein H6501_06120 [Candidatus Woesearchaeota archaeon]|nr:hypothetical protein [Nanoarchaeota archaeon]MCB9371150.1 hypothetical protein [Candidatus Woesearchaeota archaeon]USN43855.1 MAG: hypothetical protein H6500_05700 [Candidatus Woesearchaeota archaeon]
MKVLSRKGDLEISYVVKLLLAIIALIVLIVVITIVIKGEFDNQGGIIENIFSSIGK